jgi:hypothetical protein
MSWATPACFSSRPRRLAWHASLTLVVALCVNLAGWGAANAQTCEVPQTVRSDPMQMGDTCNGDMSITSVCNGEIPILGPVGVWHLRVGFGATAVLQLLGGGVGFSPAGYLVAAAGVCGEGACHGYVDPMTPLDLATVPPGDYRLIVAAAEWDAAGVCGGYGLSVTGDLGDPDRVFAYGFD